jgi:hypothetical protein
MSETTAETAPRIVDYVDPDVIALLPASFPCAWVAEESCRRVSEVASALAPDARERLLARATSFADDVLAILRASVLPEDLERALYLDPHERLQLIGGRGRTKVRVDEDFRIVLVRERPLALEGPRAGTLRQEVREVVCFPLASDDRRPVLAVQALDLSSVGEPGAFFLDLDAPAGSAYLGGRCDRLRVFGDGKVLILCFRPLPDVDDEGYQVGSPEAALAALPGSAGLRLAEIQAEGGVPAGGKGRGAARAVDVNEGLDLEGGAAADLDGASGEGGAGEGGEARGSDEDAAPPTSDFPLDQPGWAARVSPVVESEDQ